MNKKQIVWKLLNMDESKRAAIFRNAVESYFHILLDMANDIYNSCIEDYYNGYTPIWYDRHGNIEGFNLYQANSNGLPGGYLRIRTDASKLEPYKSGNADDVLGMVENGFRGGPGIKKKGWPKRWYTSYPNGYSAYRIWYSTGNTIETIMEDFQKNGISGTQDILWKCIERHVQ